MAFIGQTPGPLTTGTNIADGTITAADLHTTLDLSGKTITYPSNSVTAAALHTTAVTDKLGYTPLQSSDLTGYATESYVNTAVATVDLTGYATESYVTTAVSNLVDSAPGALDTLNELAAALNDDANFSTTITNSLALKAPLASPSFTGNVGIGTSSPTGLLTLNAATPTIDLLSSGIEKASILTGAGGNLAFYTGGVWGGTGAERMRITSDGNVGIGATGAVTNAKLNVAGGVNTTTGIVGWSVNDSFTLNGKTQPHYGCQFANTGSTPSGISGYHGLAFATFGIERMRIDTSGNLLFNSGYGSVATAYGCRAWVNVDTTTFTIRGSGNVSSVTDRGSGRGTVNFTSAMPDANYTVCGCAAEVSTDAAGDNESFAPKVLTTSGFPFTTTDATGNTYNDCYQVCISVFR